MSGGGKADGTFTLDNEEGTLLRRRKYFLRAECERHTLSVGGVAAGAGSGGYWMLRLPASLAQSLKPGERRGALKVCRRRSGAKTAVLQIRTEPRGILAAAFCQLCGKRQKGVRGGGACSCLRQQEALPWSAYSVLPFCEFCGDRLTTASRCGGCQTAEYDVMVPPPVSQEAARPMCVLRERTSYDEGGERTGFTLDQVPVVQKLDVVVPDEAAANQKTSVAAAKERDASAALLEYQKLDREAGLAFAKKRPEEVRQMVLATMRKHSTKVCGRGSSGKRLLLFLCFLCAHSCFVVVRQSNFLKHRRGLFPRSHRSRSKAGQWWRKCCVCTKKTQKYIYHYMFGHFLPPTSPTHTQPKSLRNLEATNSGFSSRNSGRGREVQGGGGKRKQTLPSVAANTYILCVVLKTCAHTRAQYSNSPPPLPSSPARCQRQTGWEDVALLPLLAVGMLLVSHAPTTHTHNPPLPSLKIQKKQLPRIPHSYLIL